MDSARDIEELSEYLAALERGECYRVERVLKRAPHETTELVFFVGKNEAEAGPFVRKRIDGNAGVGKAYEELFRAQQEGRRFRFLPRIFDCYTADESLVVVMEYIEGRTLLDAVYEDDPSLDLTRRVFPLLCDAVTELHEGFDAPIVHRDLKPSNVILTGRDLAIIDFGIARRYRDGADADTASFGTRAYAPPEQFGFGQTDVRSDVYALGMILFYCLTERTPGPSAGEEARHDPAIPPALAEVIVRATAFDPSSRYPSARSLKEAFLRAADEADAGALPAAASEASAAKTSETPMIQHGTQGVARRTDAHTSPSASAAKSGVEPVVAPSAASATSTTTESALPTANAEPASSQYDSPATRIEAETTFESRPPQTPGRIPGQAPAQPSGTAKSALLHVVTIARNVFAVGLWALFFAAATSLVFEPRGSDAALPLAVRGMMYYGCVLPPLTACAYFLLDRRAVGRLIPLLKARSWRVNLVIGAIAIIVCFIMAVLATLISS